MILGILGSMLYPAPAVAVPSPPPAPLEEVRLELETGTGVVAWLSLPEEVDRPGGGDAPVALFFHGNGENLETMRRSRLFDELRELGVIALAVDYPGYGNSSGKPNEAGVLATGPAALEWAEEHWPGRPVVLCGWSLGAAVAIRTAADAGERVDGLVAFSPWTRLRDTVKAHAPDFLAPLLFSEEYESEEAAKRVLVPALVMHGEDDRIIPVEQGERIAQTLAAAGGAEVRWIPLPNTGHNDLLARQRVWQELERFFEEL